MEKTALQQLIAWIERGVSVGNPPTAAQIHMKALELLPAERDDAKDFFKAGQKYGQQLQIETRGEGKFLNKKDFDKYYRTKYGETE